MEAIREFLKPELIWFLLGLVMLLMEFVLPGLIIFFFGVGACIVALICLILPISLNLQLVIFIISSVILLLTLRKWLKGIFLGRIDAKRDLEQHLEDFVGQKAVVTKQIEANIRGKVEFHGTNWEAEADVSIPEGTPVEIIGKESITLKVKQLEKKGDK
ncbi:MAG: NfeD family protein [Candidatus Marinimicrobia bacterium]|nr:NfeD family protein [Candidatus Neomarinimicrobiota bacterium]